MLKLRIPPALRRAIAAQARRDYPNETCGLMLGMVGRGEISVTALHPVRNAEAVNPLHRYAISRVDYETAEAAAVEARLSVVGVFHSHPDSAPVPSSIDAEFAFPGWVYLIIEVAGGGAGSPPSARGIQAWLRSESAASWTELDLQTLGG